MHAILIDVLDADNFVVAWLDDVATLAPGDELAVPERASGRETPTFE